MATLPNYRSDVPALAGSDEPASSPNQSLPLFPPVPCHRDSERQVLTPPGPAADRVGIARLAASSPLADSKRGAQYFLLPARSILNRCDSDRVPFTWTINPYRGCEFGCKYCYARYTHEFMEMRDSLEFEQKIYVKQQAGWLLRQDLKKVKPGESIALGTATDPYQPAERRYGVTCAILEEIALHAGLELGIVTKSNMILRDTEVLRRISRQNRLAINLTITTLDPKLARILEPRAPRPDLRLDAVHKLSSAGLRVGVICAPVLPGITDSPADLESLIKATAEAGGHWIYTNPLFLKPCSEKVFMPFLEKEFPNLAENYRQRYQSRAFLPDSYRKRISSLVAALREKYGLGERFGRISPQTTRHEPTQAELF